MRTSFDVTVTFAGNVAPRQLRIGVTVANDDIVLSFWNSITLTWTRIKATSADGVWRALRELAPAGARVTLCTRVADVTW